MKKYICVSLSIAAGLAICLFAPAEWRTLGVFCAGGGCYGAIEMLKMARIGREIERYEQSVVGSLNRPFRPARLTHEQVLASTWQLLRSGRQASPTIHQPPPRRQPDRRLRTYHQLLDRSIRGMSHRAATIARIFILSLGALR